MFIHRFPFSSLIWPFVYLAFIIDVGYSNQDFCSNFGFNVTSVCNCHSLENGLFLECSSPSEKSLREVLSLVTTPIKSLNVINFEDAAKTVTSELFGAGPVIQQLQFLRSNIEEIQEDAFRNLKHNLSSISFTSGKLKKIPQKALNGLKALRALNLESNEIPDIPSYSFYGLKLMKLSVKGNLLERTSEFAFAGLEKTLTELDLSENKLRVFPMTSLRLLDRLVSVRLAWNEISEVTDDSYSRLSSLQFLDLSSNNFETIPSNCFRPIPSLTVLSLYYNAIETVHRDAFVALIMLESLDISHNKIVVLDPLVFRFNKKLKTLDLSNNHIHYVSGLFEKLPELREIFLMENNILEVPKDAFTDSYSLSVIYLEQNAIRRIHSRALATLPNLSQLHLSSNYIKHIPNELFSSNNKLRSLSLDNNNIASLETGVFKNLVALKEIRLQNNKIEKIEREVFHELPSLLELHLQNNAIKAIESESFRTLRYLQHVNLQGNLMVSLDGVFLQESPSLVSVQLDSNRIESLQNTSFRSQGSVEILRLGHNRLTQLARGIFKDLFYLKIIYLTNNSISAIEDKSFEPMQALKHLDLSLNRLAKITRYTFWDLGQLEELNLSSNAIEFIEPYALTTLKKLRVLDLSDNRLRKLHASIFQEKLPLRHLILKNCQIEEIEKRAFTGLNDLFELDLENNKIPSESLNRLDIPGLKRLKASGNSFSSPNGILMKKMQSLEILILDNSSVKHLPENFLSKNNYLKLVSLSLNALGKLSRKVFHNFDNLEEINLKGNLFTEIPYEALADIPTLRTLNLADNSITSVHFSRLNGIPHLRVLDLKGNKIDFLTGFATANLTEIASVFLNENALTSLPANFFAFSSNLKYLDLSGNKFWQIPPVSDSAAVSLRWLKITENPLMRIHDFTALRKYSSLEEIHISRSNISVVTSRDFEAFPALLCLDLRNNQISRISPGAFKTLNGLLTLDLSLNELELLPQERLHGLHKLRVLNVSYNRLKNVDEFPGDLKELQILDLSYNQFTRIEKRVFLNLGNLAELHLTGNWISSVAGDSFRSLKKLRILDLSRNYLENLPLNAFRPLETQIRSLRTEENPINCSCEQQELWEWLQDHQKLLGVAKIGLKCEHPPELRGLLFMELPPPKFCSTPLVLKLAIQDIQPFSIIVSWQSRNHSGLHGYNVIYTEYDRNDLVQIQLFDKNVRTLKVTKLDANTKYMVCVVGLGTWLGVNENEWTQQNFSLQSLELLDSSISKCTEVKTLETPEVSYGKGSGDKWDSSNSILTRRLGLIVGSCMGSIVFFVLVSVLGYLKIKKQRQVCNRDQPLPPEYLSYRGAEMDTATTVIVTCEPQRSNNDIIWYPVDDEEGVFISTFGEKHRTSLDSKWRSHRRARYSGMEMPLPLPLSFDPTENQDPSFFHDINQRRPLLAIPAVPKLPPSFQNSPFLAEDKRPLGQGNQNFNENNFQEIFNEVFGFNKHPAVNKHPGNRPEATNQWGGPSLSESASQSGSGSRKTMKENQWVSNPGFFHPEQQTVDTSFQWGTSTSRFTERPSYNEWITQANTKRPSRRPTRPINQSDKLIFPDEVSTQTTTPSNLIPTDPPTMSPCERSCPVTPEFNPVCGSDAVTYSNAGRLKCAQFCGKNGQTVLPINK